MEVLTPEDMVMSKAERDRVCEAIGDEPGAWAKRRKEIEGLNKEVVKAKIKRTDKVKTENLLRQAEKSSQWSQPRGSQRPT